MDIITKDLSLKLDNTLILENISFEIDSGEFVILIGPNGSGKTSLLKSLVNLVDINSGKAQLYDKNINHMNRKEIAKKISYLPQIKENLPPIKVKDFLLYSRFPYLKYFSSYSAEDISIIEETAKEFKIEKMLDRILTTLSGGEMQRTLIASSVVQQTDIILLDEPTTFLDPNHRWEIFNMLENINNKQNKTIILVTHFLEYVLNFGEKIIALKNGKMFFNGDVKTVCRKNVLNDLFDFELNIFKHKDKFLIDFPDEKI